MKSLHRCFIAAALACVPAYGQSAEWNRTMLIYLLGAGLDGKSQVGPLETDLEQSFSDILESLDVGGMGAFHASNGTWTHTIDVIYINLSGNETLPSDVRFDAEIDQLIASYDIGYELAEHFELLAGVRYNSIDADLAVRLPAGASRVSGDKDWFDPYVGVRSTIAFNDTFALTLRGDIGGFDIGSKLAWQAVVWLGWNFSETFFATFGYRVLDTDYEDGSGASVFKYDVAIHGPGVGVGWRFR